MWYCDDLDQFVNYKWVPWRATYWKPDWNRRRLHQHQRFLPTHEFSHLMLATWRFRSIFRPLRCSVHRGTLATMIPLSCVLLPGYSYTPRNLFESSAYLLFIMLSSSFWKPQQPMKPKRQHSGHPSSAHLHARDVYSLFLLSVDGHLRAVSFPYRSILWRAHYVGCFSYIQKALPYVLTMRTIASVILPNSFRCSFLTSGSTFGYLHLIFKWIQSGADVFARFLTFTTVKTMLPSPSFSITTSTFFAT